MLKKNNNSFTKRGLVIAFLAICFCAGWATGPDQISESLGKNKTGLYIVGYDQGFTKYVDVDEDIIIYKRHDGYSGTMVIHESKYDYYMDLDSTGDKVLKKKLKEPVTQKPATITIN